MKDLFAWLVYDREGADRNRDYIAYHDEVGSRYGIRFRLVYNDEINDKIIADDKPDFCIVRTMQTPVYKVLEDAGIRCYNSHRVSHLTDHKGRCIEYINAHTSVSVVPTRVVKKNAYGDDITGNDAYILHDITGQDKPVIFENIQARDKYILSCDGYVIKSATGHGGNEVMRLPGGKDGDISGKSDSGYSEELSVIISGWLQNDDVIIQPFISGPGEDVRVYVIGDEIVAAVKRRVSSRRLERGEFRANASLGGDVTAYELSDDGRDLVSQITDQFDFGMAGIDFIIDDGGRFIFNEIENVVGARMLYRCCPDIDILDKYLRYIAERER